MHQLPKISDRQNFVVETKLRFPCLFEPDSSPFRNTDGLPRYGVGVEIDGLPDELRHYMSKVIAKARNNGRTNIFARSAVPVPIYEEQNRLTLMKIAMHDLHWFNIKRDILFNDMTAQVSITPARIDNGFKDAPPYMLVLQAVCVNADELIKRAEELQDKRKKELGFLE